MLFLLAVGFAVAWVGHACACTAALNRLYGLALPKRLLKGWRTATGVVILAFPAILWSAKNPYYFDYSFGDSLVNGVWGWVVLGYALACLFIGGVVFPWITDERYFRKPPACLVREQTRTLDLWAELGAAVVGNGKGRPLTRLPGNCVFNLDITDYTLALPNLPPAWNGLTVLFLSDLHFHGTPSRLYFERIIEELSTGPVPDLVCLGGDFVDTDTHYAWIQPLLGRLRANEAKLAILGNHDKYHDPDRVRVELRAAGYTVLGNGWQEVAVRGVRCVAVGHEGPWFRPPPDLSGAPAPEEAFRLCLSHTPDNFPWGVRNAIGLMLAGHVHGGGIRVPVVGSIFVPSVYGRRFDHGVFEDGGSVLVVGRGVSGKEPLRIRCNPQVVRMTLVPAGAARPAS